MLLRGRFKGGCFEVGSEWARFSDKGHGLNEREMGWMGGAQVDLAMAAALSLVLTLLAASQAVHASPLPSVKPLRPVNTRPQ